jgi:hypothetical protein
MLFAGLRRIVLYSTRTLPVKNTRFIYVFGMSRSVKSDQSPEQFKALN